MIKKKIVCGAMAAVMMCSAAPAYISADTYVYAEYDWAGSECDPAHDPSRDVQKYGVGNPFNYGERNTPANASTAEIRAINHKMSVQEVKYALYKEIDEHWDLISKRIGQTEREKVYALFLGLGTRESTLGGNGDGADLETAYLDGFGVNSAHAYGTMQTAVTAFADCNPEFMKEDNVPEMYQYTFNESNFYDAIISNHMGIRKILHFVQLCIDEEKMTGYQVIRNSLKAFNTGWWYMAEDAGAYRTYADEICAMAQFYYNEGHLYDNVFTWTESPAAAPYRTDNRWDWWGDGVPSMDPVETTSEPESESDTQIATAIKMAPTLLGDANLDKQVNIADAVLVMQVATNPDKYGQGKTDVSIKPQGEVNADVDGKKGLSNADALLIQKFKLGLIQSL